MPDVVVTVGTVSKVLAPGLRVGWLHAPEVVRAAVLRAKQGFDLHTSTFTQSVVAEILSDTAFVDRHLARLRQRYAVRSAALAGALAGDRVSFATPRGGLFLWVELRGVDTTALFETALAHDIMFVPGTRVRRRGPLVQPCATLVRDAAGVDAPNLRGRATQSGLAFRLDVTRGEHGCRRPRRRARDDPGSNVVRGGGRGCTRERRVTGPEQIFRGLGPPAEVFDFGAEPVELPRVFATASHDLPNRQRKPRGHRHSQPVSRMTYSD